MTDMTALSIPAVKLIKPRRFGDERGFFSETWREDWNLLDGGIAHAAFRQDNHAYSGTKGTIRGLHFQTGPSTQAKLLRTVVGAILDVAVDIRKGSPTYGHVVAETLSAENGHQLFVPHGFAHAYQTLTDETHVLYKVDRYYDPAREGAVRWSDPDIAVPWADVGVDATLSTKDEAAPLLADFDSPFVYDEAAPYFCRCLGD